MQASKTTRNIRIGPAGWSYPDWKGYVYPGRRRGKFDQLTFIASLFDLIEINSTFYRTPDPLRTGEWVSRVSDFPLFRFTVKLFQGFTHTGKASVVDERAFHRALEPLVRFHRLAAVLIQWPWSFKNTLDNRKKIEAVVRRFRTYPLAVEVRHDSWAAPDVPAFFAGLGVAFCNIDQPGVDENLGPAAHVTSDISYFRFHGRNAEAWSSRKAGRDERFNYLYDARELDSWIEKVEEAALNSRRVAVVFNNHFKGQAVVNAFQFQHALSKKKQPVPVTLIEAYPILESISSTVFQRSLFTS